MKILTYGSFKSVHHKTSGYCSDLSYAGSSEDVGLVDFLHYDLSTIFFLQTVYVQMNILYDISFRNMFEYPILDPSSSTAVFPPKNKGKQHTNTQR